MSISFYIQVRNCVILKYMNNKYKLLGYIDPLKILNIKYFSVSQKININIKNQHYDIINVYLRLKVHD